MGNGMQTHIHIYAESKYMHEYGIMHEHEHGCLRTDTYT
jgi:hypothetical protein